MDVDDQHHYKRTAGNNQEVWVSFLSPLTVREARQVMLSRPRIRFAEKGHTKGNDVYAAFGQTFGGRYLAVYFVHKPDTATAIIISARDMSTKERKRYGRK